jgi:adenylate cyclase
MRAGLVRTLAPGSQTIDCRFVDRRMSEGRVERRLMAILAADVAGYSRLIGIDEEGTLASLRAIRREIVDPKIAEHRGRIVKTTGDGVLAEFHSVIEALRCAMAWQKAMPADGPIAWRIGIHQGDIVVEDGDIFGDGVNIAARLEAFAEPGRICVSARVQEDAAGKLDAEFEDLGERQFKNIIRPVRVYRIAASSWGATGDTPAAARPPLSLPDRPSIAVLPFHNLSGDPEQDYFADGMVEEIITALSRIRWLFVVARNSSFVFRGQAVDMRQVGRELGVRYVLEGSVRKAGGRVRITAQLIDAETGAHVWADRFDGSLEDVFDLQDRIATSVAGVIEPALQGAEIRRSIARPIPDLTAYDLFLRALAAYFPITQERTLAALQLFERAIEIDPNYGPALSWAAVCHWQCFTDGWAEAPKVTRQTSIGLARRALEASRNDDPGVLANVSFILANFGEDIGAMIGLIDRALALNPSFARGWHVSGLLRLYAGDLDRAVEHVETALRLSPRERIGTPLVVIGLAFFFQRRFAEAAAKLLLAVQENPGSATYRILAACHAHMGRIAEARDAIAQLRAITPQIMPSALPWRLPEHRELLLSGLRLAAEGETDRRRPAG